MRVLLLIIVTVTATTSLQLPSATALRPRPLMARRVHVACAAEEPVDGLTIGAIAAGLVSNPVMWVSLSSVATTGGGLPAGPFGFVGLLEGVSYLVVVGYVGASVYKKVTTGAGLPAGPAGLIGACEGLSYLSLVAGLAVLAFVATGQGCVPNAQPLLDYSSVLPVCK